MPQERLPKQALLAKANRKRPRPGWNNYVEDLKSHRLGIHPSEMLDMMRVWQLNLELLPRNPHGKAGFFSDKVVLSIS